MCCYGDFKNVYVSTIYMYNAKRIQTCSIPRYSPCCSHPMSNTYLPFPDGWKTKAQIRTITFQSALTRDLFRFKSLKT